MKKAHWTGLLSTDWAHAEGFPPNATEEQKAYYWDKFNHITHCSNCMYMFDDREVINWNYCPNCGCEIK